MPGVTERLQAGEPAPTFSLKDQSGSLVSLGDFAGRKVLVYFYPKADTPGCTTQACSLRDARPDLGETAVLGISPDKPEDQDKFDKKFNLGFPLLADEDHSVAEAYQVWGERSMYGKTFMGIKRSAFLVDEQGNLEKVWYDVSPADTVPNLLGALKG
jgi:peroxiredoxin Q/BCP